MGNDTNPAWRLQTRCIHAGEGVDTDTRALRRPIHMANSFELSTDLEDLMKQLTFEDLSSFVYTREHSPTPRHLEERLAALEGGEDCIVAASGMGAIAATLFTLLSAGDHVVAAECCYTGTQKLLASHFPRFGVAVSQVDTSDLDAVAAAVTKKTRVVYVETPGNPVVLISDIEKIAEIAHANGALLIVDSTWSGLVTQRPLALGANLVIHSTTKYINGHGDALGGAVIGEKARLDEIREAGIVHLGACISPFNAWLILRGSVTLPMRMQRHCENARKVAAFLSGHEKVAGIRYPGLTSHEGYDIARRQMTAPGGMLNFNLHTDFNGHFEFIKHLKLIAHAVSLGHDQSLIYYLPTFFFFHDMVVFDDAQKQRYTEMMGEGVFRFSVGLEDADDIIGDLAQALDRLP